mgnify:CR=1 FL=1
MKLFEQLQVLGWKADDAMQLIVGISALSGILSVFFTIG